ncbi:O-methyltransferase [Nesterenkonia sp. HG001]|uniref:O-methyltransferase n=1 Tax=Nesterenkonia sp. HG001 TaxID=2983207 RepID=UPI002AC39048|nr:O-methyltransferase [Nesterenkonia sp. HG001]MDZ5077735.1 O-methyltransferase [Nesterenkonia sp. HG001]
MDTSDAERLPADHSSAAETPSSSLARPGPDVGAPEAAAVDAYVEQAVVRPGPEFAAVQRRAEEGGLPAIEVSAAQGKHLELMVRISGARQVLEVGTLAGFSTLWMARALDDDGGIVTCEVESHHAAVARSNLDAAGVGEKVDIRLGSAEQTLQSLVEEVRTGAREPFDLVFLDADKAGNPRYLELVMEMVRPGTVIIGDNVVRDGGVLEADSDDPDIQGIRRFLTMQGEHPRLEATAVQTVGAKSWDGFSLAVVTRG